MNYFITEPSEEVRHLVKSFWMIESDDVTPSIQKIVPDGYPEIIFHYGDSFECNFNGNWELQSKSLLAGQIRNFFYLKNTGKTGMFAIKFQPTAITELFGTDMAQVVDKVSTLDFAQFPNLLTLRDQVVQPLSFEEKRNIAEKWIHDNSTKNLGLYNKEVNQLAHEIIRTNGIQPLKGLIQNSAVSERSLERYFKKYVGLSPKFFSRVVRLSYIFSMVEDEHADWMSITFAAGFYDQSHFIKDFKNFTGDEPTHYPFLEKTWRIFF